MKKIVIELGRLDDFDFYVKETKESYIMFRYEPIDEDDRENYDQPLPPMVTEVEIGESDYEVSIEDIFVVDGVEYPVAYLLRYWDR